MEMHSSTTYKAVVWWILFIIIPVVECRNCFYNGYGHTKYFYCAANEYCCGAHCCQAVYSFYRLWYFWMSIILIFVFCSGGGYWYRRRYIQQRVFINHQMNVAAAGDAIPMTNRRPPMSGQTAMCPNQQQNIGMTFSPQAGVMPLPPGYPHSGSGAVYYAYPTTTFYGPPPSYDSVYNPTTRIQVQSIGPAGGGLQMAPSHTQVTIPNPGQQQQQQHLPTTSES
ncbi:WW domain binding protein VOPP1-like [Tubulanus polymorphus]|uniref:WW domain binding protein VOPP1-like n=1 Tax=Tubulanus polymorphus TaxID=672921 RepID=UPI003DA64952